MKIATKIVTLNTKDNRVNASKIASKIRFAIEIVSSVSDLEEEGGVYF